jgi:hypothetical protein
MTPSIRKLLLTAHITLSVGWFGAVAAFLALAIVGLTSRDAEMVRIAYAAMELTARFVIVPLAFASLLSGIVQSMEFVRQTGLALLGNSSESTRPVSQFRAQFRGQTELPLSQSIFAVISSLPPLPGHVAFTSWSSELLSRVYVCRREQCPLDRRGSRRGHSLISYSRYGKIGSGCSRRCSTPFDTTWKWATLRAGLRC